MGRPREFDETAVLNAATQLFWTRGFEAVLARTRPERALLKGVARAATALLEP